MMIRVSRRGEGRPSGPVVARGGVDFVLSMVIVGVVAMFAGLAYWSAISVEEHEAYAVVQSSGRLETGDGPAIFFRVPFVNEIITYPRGDIETTYPAMRLLTKSKATIPLKVSVRWKISDKGRFHDAVYSSARRAESRISAYTQKALKDVVGRTDPVDASSLEAIAQAVIDNVNPKAEEIGVELTNIAIEQVDRIPGQ